jgi:iron complex outermembrane receptor protein
VRGPTGSAGLSRSAAAGRVDCGVRIAAGALATLLACGFARAAAGESDTAPAAGEADSSGAPAPTGAAVLPDVIVTSNKQAQALQKTAGAISALSGDELLGAGVTDIRAAQQLLPSVRFQQQNLATEIYIRGVGSTLDFPQIESPTSFNLNGITVPREASSVPLYDIESLEVLPGPQGTLYGRSTLGGAVNVAFRRPTMERETDTLIEAGNYGLIHASAAQNLPISPALAVRAAVDYQAHAGYETSGADAQRDLAARVSALLGPSSGLTLYLWGSTVSKAGHPPNLVVKGVNPATGQLDPNSYLTASAWNDQFPAPYAAALPFGQPRAQQQSYANTMLGGQADWVLADATVLTWIPSYLDLSSSPDYWLGAFPGNETNNYRQFTNEFRAAATRGWGSWLGGLYGYHLDSSGRFTFGGFTPATGFPVSIVDRNRIEGEALFGQVTLALRPALRAIAGGRLSLDDRIGDGRFFDGTGLAPFTYARRFHHVDYKLGLDYDLAPATLLYVATQTGYQPGTFNAYASTPAASNAIDPARLTAYSTGIKARALDGRLQVNDEVFYDDYRGLFASSYNTVLNSNQTFNAQKVRIVGNQLDVACKPTAADRIDVSLGTLHARNVRFELPDGTANFDGLQLQYAPDWSATARLSHDFALPAGHLRVQAGSRYEDAFYADFRHTPGGRQQASFKSDAALTYYSDQGGWSVGLWVRNIENVAVIAATAAGSNIPPLAAGATAFVEPPRTYGLRITWNL